MNAAPPLISTPVVIVEIIITGTTASTLSFAPGRLLVLRAMHDAGVQTPVGTIVGIEPSTPLVFG